MNFRRGTLVRGDTVPAAHDGIRLFMDGLLQPVAAADLGGLAIER